MVKITKSNFLKALEGSYGNMSVISKNLGCGRAAVCLYVTRHELRHLIKEEQEKLLDLAENKLGVKLNSGDMKALKFFLSTKGKNRGYVARQELEHAGKVSVPVKFEGFDERESNQSDK